jgi:activator of HSP90 ATPase
MLEKDTIGSALAEPTRRRVLIEAALAVGGFVMATAKSGAAPALEASPALSPPRDGITRSAASIHQEVVFAAARKRVYEALTDANLFEKVVELSGVRKGSASKVPATISLAEGGAFALFDGYITGRQVELVPNELIVQAWRSASWGAGLYSIARFQIVDSGSGSKIIFDQGGFPNDQAAHLAAGWQANYWTPLGKLLSP